MFNGINSIEFARTFPDTLACQRFLDKWKWPNGFHCHKCGSTRYGKGKTSFHRRCLDCRYDESITANTILHDMRMPPIKALYLLFRIACKKKGMSTVELGSEVGVQQKTAWLFKSK